MTELKCCYGVSSKADECFGHVLYFDYDKKDFKSFKEYLLQLQQEYLLSNIYIIKSTNGYNAVCLDVMSIGLIYSIGNSILSPCDRDFYKYGFDRGYYTLRFSDDKKLVCILKSNSKRYEKSFVHKVFLEWFFDIKIPFDNKFNDFTKIRVIQYPSEKNGYHRVNKIIPDYITRLKGVKND